MNKTIRLISAILPVAIVWLGQMSSTDAANIWLSPSSDVISGTAPPLDPTEILQIDRGFGASGSFFVWAQPDSGKTLANWSLNIVSDDPNVVKFTTTDVSSFNPVLVSPSDKRRWEYVGEPAAPSGTPSSNQLDRIQGFSIPINGSNNSGIGIGTGPQSAGGGVADPFAANGSWLIARVDFQTGTTAGLANIHLQIGAAGFNQIDAEGIFESSALTEVLFGATSDDSLNASTERNQNSITPELKISVSDVFEPSANFDMDNDVDGQDFLTWQRGFGIPSGPGDANGDQLVDATDLAVWEQQFASSQGTLASLNAAPEPSSALLVIVGTLLLFGRPSRQTNMAQTRNRCRPPLLKDHLPNRVQSAVIAQSQYSNSLAAAMSSLQRTIASTFPKFGLTVLCILANTVPCFAQSDYTWNNPAGGDWFDANNWAELGRPLSHTHNATIDLAAGSAYDVTLASKSFVGNVTIDSIDANLASIASPGGTLLDIGGSEVNLLNGSVSGPTLFKTNSVTFQAVNVGSPTNFTGDFTLDFFHTSHLAKLNTFNNELIPGRVVNIYEVARLTAAADVFTNYSEINVGLPKNPTSGASGLFEVANGSTQGVLENYGLLSAPSSLTGAGFFLSLDNKPTGIVNFSASSNQLARLGRSLDGFETHHNEGTFISDRETFIHGVSFTNTGNMELNAGGTVDVDSFYHSGGTLNLGGELILDGISTFRVSQGGAILTQPGSKISVQGIIPTSENVVELVNGSISGPAVFTFDSATPPSVLLGAATDFTGDLTLNFNPISANNSVLTILDNQLVAGRTVNVSRSTQLTLNSSTFSNRGVIEVGVESPLQGSGPETTLVVDDGNSQGKLINRGQILVTSNAASTSFDFELENTSSGVVDISGIGGNIDEIGSGIGEVHLNEGHITSRRQLLFRGQSFSNLGTMDMKGVISDFQVDQFNHSGGVISLNNNLIRVNSFSLTNGASLEGSFSRGLQVRASDINQVMREVHLLDGSITGGMGVELNGNVLLNIASDSEFTGDFDIFVKRGFGGTPTQIIMDDNQLPAGRKILQLSGGTLDIVSSEFTNHGTISMRSTAFDPKVRIADQVGTVGRLINSGQLVVVPNSPNESESGRKRLEFELHNTAGGVVDIDAVDDQDFNGRRTFLGNPNQSDNHVNDGTFNISKTTNLLILGNSFANNGTVNGSGVFGGRQFITQTPLIGGAEFINNGTVNENGTDPGDKLVFGTPVSGTGSFTGNIEFQNRYAPGNSPAIVHVEDITLTDSATLEMEIGGLTAGTQHDRLIVSGTATLGGRLDLPLINGFIPAMDDFDTPITIITTTGAGTIAGGFREATSLNLPDDVAIEVTEGINSVSVKFVDPATNGYKTDTVAGDWSNPNIWLTGVVPKTNENTDLLNASVSTNNTVTVDVDAFINEIDVDGGTGTMKLIVPSTKSLSAINSVNVNDSGIIELTGGTLLSGNIDVNDGGVVMGTGELVGNVMIGSGSGEGMFKPGSGVGNIDIDGNYQQQTGGTLVIEVAGKNAGEFDTISITDNAAFGGKLEVVVADPTDLAAGDVIEVVTAGSLTAGAVFDTLEVTGLDPGLYLAPLYDDGTDASQGEIAAISDATFATMSFGVYNLGDMDGVDGLNEADVMLFAMVLSDPDAFAQLHGPTRFLAADIEKVNGPGCTDPNGCSNGQVDFDDIDDFVALFPASQSAQVYSLLDAAFSVPEPSGVILLLSATALRMGSRRRGPTRRREIS